MHRVLSEQYSSGMVAGGCISACHIISPISHRMVGDPRTSCSGMGRMRGGHELFGQACGQGRSISGLMAPRICGLDFPYLKCCLQDIITVLACYVGSEKLRQERGHAQVTGFQTTFITCQSFLRGYSPHRNLNSMSEKFKGLRNQRTLVVKIRSRVTLYIFCLALNQVYIHSRIPFAEVIDDSLAYQASFCLPH